MSDLISRHEACKALDRIEIPRNEPWYTFYQKALERLCELPSAEKKGRWLEHPFSKEYMNCSCCGFGTKLKEYGVANGVEYEETYMYSYCPHCGARLKLYEEETDE